jgi:PBP1b-binding outer membrane lipoprotein LpoB
MKNINLLLLLVLFLSSCNNNSGQVDPVSADRVDTAVVKSIALTSGKYQDFEVTCALVKDGTIIKHVTEYIDFNIGDTVIVIN